LIAKKSNKFYMKPKLIFIGFLTSILAMMLTGYFAVEVGERLAISFERQGEQFRTVTTAAAQVISYSKRAEGHLLLYLMLHNPVDKGKFPKRIASLEENIAVLDQVADNPQALAILNKIKKYSGKNLSIGNSLIAHHDQAMRDTGQFPFEAYKEIILQLHERFSEIRRCGVDLTSLLIKLEDNQRSQAQERANKLRFYLFLFVGLAACFALYMGYALSKIISSLRREIAERVKFEQELGAERDKLQDALSHVKTLSGLIPICSSCKKIRDDQGYWNQVETYISQHSDAQLSHGLCPDCVRDLYPDVYEKIIKDGKQAQDVGAPKDKQARD
jgi:hypothetical protein